MKILFPLFIVLVLVIGCSPEKKSEPSVQTEEEIDTPEKPEVEADVELPEGLVLIRKNDCPTCHRNNIKIVGPTYAQIAESYKENNVSIDTLVSHILKGNVGKWGQIPMIAHPDLKIEDARKMVDYIISEDYIDE